MSLNMASPKELFFEKVFDSLPDGVIVLDEGFKVIGINEAAQSMFEISRKKALGMPSEILIPSEMEQVAAKALAQERAFCGEEMNIDLPSGHRISVQPVASPLHSQKGDIVGVLLQIKDVQASKFLSLQDTQHSSASTLEGLFFGLAHELKNPLSGIRGAAQLLINEENESEASFSANIIIKEVERLTSLIDGLKKLQPFTDEDFTPVDVNEVLYEMYYLESRSSTNEHIEFELNLDVALPAIQGDRNALKQAFLNLFKNSIQAIGERGKVSINTRWISGYKLNGHNTIEIEFKDNGIGIEEEQIKNIFKPFYSTKEGGAGLGLFLAYQIIAKHDGAIMVDSQRDKGTSMRVYLPVTD